MVSFDSLKLICYDDIQLVEIIKTKKVKYI